MRLATWSYVDELDNAVKFYQEVFGAKIKENEVWKKPDGTYFICTFELDGGGTFSLAAREGKDAIEGKANTGNIMQLCMYYRKNELDKLENAYAKLIVGAEIRTPLESSEFTSHTCDLIDKYGVRWCLMVWGE